MVAKLNSLTAQIFDKMRTVVTIICGDLKHLYEPFWEEPVKNNHLKEHLGPRITAVCHMIDNVRIGIYNDHSLPLSHSMTHHTIYRSGSSWHNGCPSNHKAKPKEAFL